MKLFSSCLELKTEEIFSINEINFNLPRDIYFKVRRKLLNFENSLPLRSRIQVNFQKEDYGFKVEFNLNAFKQSFHAFQIDSDPYLSFSKCLKLIKNEVREWKKNRFKHDQFKLPNSDYSQGGFKYEKYV